MKKSEFDKLIELSYTGGFRFSPINQNAIELCNSLGIGEIIKVDLKTERDYKFHQAYFVLIGFIYDYLPDKFKNKVPKQHF